MIDEERQRFSAEDVELGEIQMASNPPGSGGTPAPPPGTPVPTKPPREPDDDGDGEG